MVGWVAAGQNLRLIVIDKPHIIGGLEPWARLTWEGGWRVNALDMDDRQASDDAVGWPGA